jgi:hypothetical protein
MGYDFSFEFIWHSQHTKIICQSFWVEGSVRRAQRVNKEKNELQEINEKMLYMLTEKELENDDLNEKFENFKL